MGSKTGLRKLLQAREYNKFAKGALDFVKVGLTHDLK
jgi:hypothetical protein